MRAQITLTVAEGKRLIAEAIAQMPEIRRALETGKILLKGGTTVSAVMERLCGKPMRISGRISSRGTKSSVINCGHPHNALFAGQKITSIDECFPEAVKNLDRYDVAVIGANALDPSGRTAIMFGSPLGSSAGLGLAGLMAQGCKIIIACGLEKFIPTPIEVAVGAAGICSLDWSMGMAVGLTPLMGDVITEKTALEKLAQVNCTIIGAGGIGGAEGALTMVLEGDGSEVQKAVEIVLGLKESPASGEAESLQECAAGAPGCAVHQACAWRQQKTEKLRFKDII